LIPDLQDGIAYTAFLNGLLPGRFKFSLAESKVTILVDALRKLQDFIQATKICAGDEPQHQKNRKRSGEGRDFQLDKRSKQNEERAGCFHTSLLNILMEIKGSPMLRLPKPIETPTNFRNKNKYCEYHQDFGHTTSECRELKKALHEMADQGQLNRFLKQRKGANQNQHDA